MASGDGEKALPQHLLGGIGGIGRCPVQKLPEQRRIRPQALHRLFPPCKQTAHLPVQPEADLLDALRPGQGADARRRLPGADAQCLSQLVHTRPSRALLYAQGRSHSTKKYRRSSTGIKKQEPGGSCLKL